MSTGDPFPTISPTINSLDSIIGPGKTLLRKDSIAVASFDEVQLRCCGLVRLSTFIALGDAHKTKRGFYPFFVFVIFPIHLNPWASLCKKMTERQSTQFQDNSLLACTGKVAGLLDPRLLVRPPSLEQDYVLIVVPETWTFLDKSITPSDGQATSGATTPTKCLPPSPSSSSTPFERAIARYTTPRQSVVLSTPSSSMSPTPTPPQTQTQTPPQTPAPLATTTIRSQPNIPRVIAAAVPTPKRPYPAQGLVMSNKRPRQLLPQQSLGPVLSSVENESSISNSTSFISDSTDSIHDPEPSSDVTSLHATSLAKSSVPAGRPGTSVPALDSIMASSSEPTSRPHRSRMATKKYEELVNHP